MIKPIVLVGDKAVLTPGMKPEFMRFEMSRLSIFVLNNAYINLGHCRQNCDIAKTFRTYDTDLRIKCNNFRKMFLHF